MRNRLYKISASVMLIAVLLSLAGVLLFTSKTVLGIDQVTGAIWTTDPDGERVNGNLYTNAKDVYLSGGPHKEGAAGLLDGVYYFQVTDPPGKNLLSTDELWKRRFEVKNGYIFSINGGKHKWNNDTTRHYGIVVQIWPFTFTPNKGGVYKVWVTKVEHYTPSEGCFGFVPSLSKTDNFKVKLEEVPKYFELWVTDGISAPSTVEFYVNYTVDGDGNPSSLDPVSPWTTGQLIYDWTENGYDVFRYETTFALGTYIYCRFFVFNAFTWTSDVYGPELIDKGGMVNKEILFMVNGHKYRYPDNAPLEGWTIELYRDGVKIAEAQTSSDGYYEFLGIGPGNYMICEVDKSDEGWAPYGPTFYEFTIDVTNGGDFTFDFYNYKMLQITDTSDCRWELSSFDVVFTPSNEDPGKYKLSSTNPGSFYTNVMVYEEVGKHVRIEIGLPPDGENDVFDSPNFILHHTYIGSTPVVDVHVYGGRLDSSGWVPDWWNDVTNQFNLTVASDGKHVTVEGVVPESGVVFVTVHIDYQISAALTWEQVQMFSDFEYTFSVDLYASIFGITTRFPVGGARTPSS